MSRLSACLIRWAACLLLAFPLQAHAGGMTIDPAASASSSSGTDGAPSPDGSETPDGSASGGYAQGSATGSLYNPSLGTGIVADPYAPSFAQLSGLNGYQSALGFGSGSSVSGDPVNMVTGNLIHSERDIAIKGRGGLPLVFERWYNSQAAKDGPLGYGWTHSFNHRLRFYGVESGVAKVAWIDGTGGERYFATANHSSGNIATGATFSGSAGITATLERLADGTYRITERSGMQYRFENITASATDSGQKARLLSIADKNGNPLSLSYAAATGCPGTDVCKVSDGLNRALTFERDPLGRITGAYNEEGHRVSLARDADGKPRSVTDPNHLTTSYDYYHGAEDGRLKRTTLPTVAGQTQGRSVEIAAYDGAGRPTQINALGADGSTRDSYNFFDELGRLTRAVGPPVSATDPSRPVTCLVYTVLGDTKEIWAGGTTDTVSSTCNLADASLKKQLARTYDDFGRKLTETDQNGKTWKWTWNLHNQLVSSQTPTQLAAGQSTTYAWGAKGMIGETQGQLKQRSVPGAQTVVAYSYTYDPAQRLRTVTDARGSNSVAKMLTYTWTPGGRLARIEDSDGHSTSLSYDAVGRLASLAAPNGENIAFTWDAGGRLVEQRLNSGQRTTQSWFEDGGLKQKQNLFNTTVLSSHLYTIDQQGRRAGQTETINTSTKTWSYLYDNLDRIVSASDGTAETTSYDIYGNRRSKTTGATTTAYLYDLAHQLSEVSARNQRY